METQPFRFLTLPSELRLMVYEQISISTHHHLLAYADHRADLSMITIVVQSLPVALLATCKQVGKEATPILDTKLREIRTTPLRLVVDRFSSMALVTNPLIQLFDRSRTKRIASTPQNLGPDAIQQAHEVVSQRFAKDLRLMDEELEAHVSTCRLLANQPRGRHVDLCGFIEAFSRKLARSSAHQYSSTRPVDIEIWFSDDIDVWSKKRLHFFIYQFDQKLYTGRVAIAIMGRDEHAVSASNSTSPGLHIWRLWSLTFSQRWPGILVRTPIVLKDKPNGNSLPEGWEIDE